MNDSPAAIFVYGTLQRGQEREGCWPRAPQDVIEATIGAELYDLGPYPAIIRGSDRVGGELWKLDPDDMPETLRVLDEIEGFGQEGGDLYERRIVACTTVDGETVEAYAYFYADEDEARKYFRVLPDDDGICRWRPSP